MVSAGLADQNLLMMTAFDGIYLVQLDADEWGWGQTAPGFYVKGVPIFFRLDSGGAPTGDKIDGGAWGEDTYENISRVMGPWLHQP